MILMTVALHSSSKWFHKPEHVLQTCAATLKLRVHCLTPAVSQVEPLSPATLEQKPCENAVRSLQSVIQVHGKNKEQKKNKFACFSVGN